MKQKYLQVAAELFPQYPSKNELHFTIDGMPFISTEKAAKHAARLADAGIVTVTREDVAPNIPAPDATPQQSDAE